MPQSQKATPRWVQASREFVDKIRDKVSAIRGAGQEEIRMGLEKVTVANNIEREVGYVGRIVR